MHQDSPVDESDILPSSNEVDSIDQQSDELFLCDPVLSNSNQIITREDYVFDQDEDGTAEDESGGTVGDHGVALRAYFMHRLVETVLQNGGDASQLDEWRAEVFRWNEGASAGLVDVIYLNEQGKKYRTRADVIIALGIAPAVRTLRAMNRPLLHDLSSEVRERLLISQLLNLYAPYGLCSEVLYSQNEIVMNFLNSTTESIDPILKSPRIKPFFAIGNTTILSWGDIIPDPAFHTTTQIYPLGFRCLRQEHDVVTDRIVDCLCEVDSSTEERIRIPVFRITISWITDINQLFIRVYEARSPQLAWQAAMLEPLGIHEPIASTDLLGQTENSDPFIMDEEELQLRSELGELRRDYFRALRNEQALGAQGVLKPRLAVDNVEGFGDELVQRLIEGMSGAQECEAYQFLDMRVKDGGRKHVSRCISRALVAAKQLERVAKKSVSKEIVKEVLEHKKRKHEEQQEAVMKMKRAKQEERAMKVTMVAVQKQKLRDLERTVKGMRDGIVKDMKRRRAEARGRIEGAMEAEAGGSAKNRGGASDTIEGKKRLTNRGPLPFPSGRFSPLRGDTFGEMLELWGFLVTFAEPLAIETVPSIEALEKCFRYADACTKKMCSTALCYSHSLDVVSSRIVLSEFQERDRFEHATEDMKHARTVIDKMGIALCRPLMPEFYKLIGMETDTQSVANKFLLNPLTWPAITRVILLGAASRDVGLSDSDVIGAMKGRGFTTVPDATDRRVLRLCKRRVLNNYRFLEENSEAAFGFSSGFCVRIPFTYCDSSAPSFQWRELVHILETTNDCCEWKVELIIYLAIVALGGTDIPDKDRRKTSLKLLLSSDTLKMNDARKAKEAALVELRDLSDKLDSAEEKAIYHPRQAETTSLNDLRKKISSSGSSLNFATPLLNSADALKLVHRLESKRQTEELADDVAGMEDAAEENTGAIKKMDDIGDLNDLMITAADIPFEEELAKIELLSVASQRCFAVMRDIMLHSLAEPFIAPVDAAQNFDYYKKIKNPLSLSDIRRALVGGAYEEQLQLTKFYLDVNLVFENAFCFNSEISQIGQAATKISFVFERMFLETVLLWENPLLRNDVCNSCRNDDEHSASRLVFCDRCEATYHVFCLEVNELNVFDKKSEWYCPGCIEQHGAAISHHLRSATVVHPSTKSEGEVVGIDQLNMSLQFTILFDDTSREVWSSTKIYDNLLKINNNTDKSGIPVNEANTQVIFPSGYQEEDINLVSSISRGYQSWGSLPQLLPPHIDPDHSSAADRAKLKNPQASRWQRAIALLGPMCKMDDFSASDWLTILLALARRNMNSTSSALSSSIASLDSDITAVVVNHNGTSLSDIPINSAVIIGNDLTLKVESYEITSSQLESASKERMGKSYTGPGLVDNTILDANADDNDGNTVDSSNSNDSDDDLFSNASSSRSNQEILEEGMDIVRSSDGSVENAAGWEMRRLTRIRGREDALVTKTLIAEIVGTIDLNEEDGFELSTNFEYNYYNSVFQTAMKACIPRHNEIRDDTEWQRAWESKLLSLGDKQTDEQLCEFCGYNEAYLGSQFVCAFTRQEWMNYDMRCSSKENVDGVFWLPLHRSDAELETQACQKIGNKELKSGSAIAHECCADVMNALRKVGLKKSNSKDEDSVFETIVGLKRGKRSPIGIDAEGSVYWIFPGNTALFISVSEHAAAYGYCRDTAILSDIYSTSQKISRSTEAVSQVDIIQHVESIDSAPSRWRVYSNAKEIASVIAWLDEGDPSERVLRRVIQSLFPEAADLASWQIAESQPRGADSDSATANISLLLSAAAQSEEESVLVATALGNAVDNDATSEGDNEIDRNERADTVAQFNKDIEGEEVWNRSHRARTNEFAESGSPPKFQVTENALVYCEKGELIREARIYEVRKVRGIYFYNVKFIGAPRPAYLNCWFQESSLHRVTPTSSSQQVLNYEKFIRENVLTAPPYLQSLEALRYTKLADRAGAGLGRCRVAITYSDAVGYLGMLKSALLTVEAALPVGSLDENEEKWGEGFDEPWRNAVITASSPAGIMECQLILEHAIKSAWFKPLGSKLLSSLPSRAFSTKYASYSLTALRIWTLDHSLRYDKIALHSSENTSKSSKSHKKR